MLDILIKARETLSSADKFSQGFFAINEDGEEVPPEDSTAIRFCAQGAILAQENGDNWFEISKARNALLSASLLKKEVDISTVNDCQGRVAVLSVYDYLIGKVQGLLPEIEEEDCEDDPAILARFKEPIDV